MGSETIMLISVTLSYECIKKPRCSFCFLRLDQALNKLRNNNLNTYYKNWSSKYDLSNQLRQLISKYSECTICFEYNGYGLSTIDYLTENQEKVHYTMTTMPQAITNNIICHFLKSKGIGAIALSFDSAKVIFNFETKTWDIENWELAANRIKEAGIKLSCNYLIEPKIGLNIPNRVLELSDQINLLSFKPKGKLTKHAKENLVAAIMYLNTIKPVVVDNCLGVQLGYIKKCQKGKEFIHIYPNGKMVDCCFQNRCYLWK